LVFLLLVTGTALAENVLIVPPYVPYVSGCESESKHTDNAVMLDDLGRTLYFVLSDTVADYNGSRAAILSQKFYKTVSLASPTCKQNEKIRKFYISAKSDPGFLQNIFAKYQLDMIAWLDFSSGDAKGCSSRNDNNCKVSAWLKIFDGTTLQQKNIELPFFAKRKAFQPEALNGVAAAFLHFLEPPASPNQ